MSENPEVPWPNQKPVVDGVVPTEEVSQDPSLFSNDPDANNREMES